MNKKTELVLKIKEIFDSVYEQAACSLDYIKPYELLFSTILAAQCTDARVNIVTQELYVKYKTLDAFAAADIDELKRDIKSTGFYNNKAKNIILCANMLIDEYGGVVPGAMDELLKLPGVGRKTANIILGDIYGQPSVVVDTHCIRLSNRLGLTKNKDPYKIELDLKKVVPEDYQTRFCHQLVYHGRAFCKAQKPNCEECPISHLCNF